MSIKRILIALAVFFFIAAQVLGFCFVPGTDIAFFLAVGWIPYLHRVTSQLSVRWDLLASTAVYIALLAAGAHLFLRWLHREMRRADAPADPVSPAPWKWRWTLGGLLVVLLMFAAGTAAVGITHQTAWLIRSPEPLYRRGNATRDRIRCASNLRQIGQGLQMYAQANGGQLPDDLRPLLVGAIDIGPECLLCPARDDLVREDTLREAGNRLVAEGRLPYIYFGKGITAPVDPGRVVVVELLENHENDGINALYGDGTVKWHDRPDAERLLLGLGFRRVEMPRPAQ